jgi:HCOMODA/2-hydroxy-3-carboxy-muconic semialdehyde decarboxylase
MLARWLALALLAPFVISAQTPAPNPLAVIDDLVTANRILANEGILDGYGHVSVRSPANPNHYFLARAVAPGLATTADIVEYDLDSNAVNGPTTGAYLERFIHGEIYRARPDVMAVVHCHCAELIPFADTNIQLKPMHHMGYFIGPGVPIFEIRKFAGDASDMLVGTAALGKALAGVLDGKSAVLMRGHGAAVAATSLRMVTGMAYYLNLNARLQYQAIQLGAAVTYLNTEEAAKATQTYERSWDYWKSRLPH